VSAATRHDATAVPNESWLDVQAFLSKVSLSAHPAAPASALPHASLAPGHDAGEHMPAPLLLHKRSAVGAIGGAGSRSFYVSGQHGRVMLLAAKDAPARAEWITKIHAIIASMWFSPYVSKGLIDLSTAGAALTNHEPTCAVARFTMPPTRQAHVAHRCVLRSLRSQIGGASRQPPPKPSFARHATASSPDDQLTGASSTPIAHCSSRRAATHAD
jgi:hypothetical protein